MGLLDSTWPPYGGRPTTWWVYLVPFGCMAISHACEWLSFFSAIFIYHITKLTVPDIVPPWPRMVILWHIFAFLRNLSCAWYIARKWVLRLRTNKKLRELNFLPAGLAHGHEIFRVDAAFVAAHFPSRVVWDLNPTNWVIAPERAEPRPLSGKANVPKNTHWKFPPKNIEMDFSEWEEVSANRQKID